METIIDRYSIIETLQKTPLGRACRAEDRENPGLFVVVKELVPSPECGISREEIEDRYRREIAILSSLAHPAIPRLHDHGIEEDICYIVIDYHRGETLNDISLKRKDPFPVSHVIKWGIEICDVLSLFHGHRPDPIIFRDITPSNIIITAEGDVRLADFGITRYFCAAKVRDTFIMGTAGFCPPEQYGQGQSDERSDIYSVGATLFYLLTLRIPDEFASKVPPAGTLNTLVPAVLSKIVQKCLCHDRQKRYQAVEDLALDLRKCIIS